ncbi:hypothetical protein OUZ56_001975 [Daphnia magna]|uniref:Uncharacterized protein n=1 Tax=Daphnia magna TaxID=35525 RepID=A0ABR0A4B6_9CRUS|nr:hypothetical protein OUZ56_001975 [Daphnia magna]
MEESPNISWERTARQGETLNFKEKMTRFFFPTLLCDSLTIRRCWLGNCECVGDEFSAGRA